MLSIATAASNASIAPIRCNAHIPPVARAEQIDKLIAILDVFDLVTNESVGNFLFRFSNPPAFVV